MNAECRGTVYKQARRQAAWAGVWMVVAMIAMLLRPEAAGIKQQLLDQVLFLSGILMLFQFGRMFQGMIHVRHLPSTASVPLWRTLEDDLNQAIQDRPAGAGINYRDIRAFAGIDEALEHGWQFGVPVAQLGGESIPGTASFAGLTYEYDGLAPERVINGVSENQRVFGRLLYKRVDPSPSPADPPLGLSV